MNRQKRIPTILGLILLIGGVYVGVVLTGRRSNLGSKASAACNPVDLRITNITYNAFDISFVTTESCLSNLMVDNRTVNDIRYIDTETNPTASKVHYFQISNLKEKTSYSFSLINDGKTYIEKTFIAVTASKPEREMPSANLAWGRVFTPDLQPASESIVYLNIPGASPLSAFVTRSGNWNVSLATSLNDQKTDWFTPPGNIAEEIKVVSADSAPTQITSDTSRNNPVPDIILGQNSFSAQPVEMIENTPTPDDKKVGILDNITPFQVQKDLFIQNPKENDTVTVAKPDIFGIAPVNAKINFNDVSAVSITGETTSSADGTWHWMPTEDLPSGEHILTASAVDNSTGAIQTVTRKFVVLAQPDSLSFSSSSSADLATPTPTEAPTPTPTQIPIPTPTEVVRVSNPSTDSGVPTTGASLPTFILILLSLASIAGSVIMFRKTDN